MFNFLNYLNKADNYRRLSVIRDKQAEIKTFLTINQSETGVPSCRLDEEPMEEEIREEETITVAASDSNFNSTTTTTEMARPEHHSILFDSIFTNDNGIIQRLHKYSIFLKSIYNLIDV